MPEWPIGVGDADDQRRSRAEDGGDAALRAARGAPLVCVEKETQVLLRVCIIFFVLFRFQINIRFYYILYLRLISRLAS